jgi:hypothetical protein
MEVFTDQRTMIPILFGALLALFGGVLTQLIFWRISLAHSKEMLISAFRAELKNIRGTLGATLAGYRDSLRANDPPDPTVFSLPTPVFNASVGNLGQLRDADLVEHIVGFYSGLLSLSEEACRYQGIANAEIKPRDLNYVHLSATTVHVQVMDLHDRLNNIRAEARLPISDAEVESRTLFTQHAKLLEADGLSVILDQSWYEA